MAVDDDAKKEPGNDAGKMMMEMMKVMMEEMAKKSPSGAVSSGSGGPQFHPPVLPMPMPDATHMDKKPRPGEDTR